MNNATGVCLKCAKGKILVWESPVTTQFGKCSICSQDGECVSAADIVMYVPYIPLQDSSRFVPGDQVK